MDAPGDANPAPGFDISLVGNDVIVRIGCRDAAAARDLYEQAVRGVESGRLKLVLDVDDFHFVH